MTVIEQLPQKIDSNVTINVPKKIEINYDIDEGWYIVIDGAKVTHNVSYGHLSQRETKYWFEAGAPMQWLIERHLVVTKAYKEFDKAIKKVAKSTSTES